jgi:hypothetical protein
MTAKPNDKIKTAKKEPLSRTNQDSPAIRRWKANLATAPVTQSLKTPTPTSRNPVNPEHSGEEGS